MVDLHKQYLRIKSEIDAAIQEVLESTAFIQGPQVDAFSKELSRLLGSHAITCANGTDALQVAMMALNYRPGDEIILPVHTYVATAEVIALLGLKPVFVDVEEHTFNIDPKKIQEKISPRTRAIVPVHLYGQCAHMEPILDIANKHQIDVIEDAAQALGVSYTFSNGDKKFAGTIGVIGTTSFFPSKNLGAYGDGGALFTNDAALAEQVRMICNHGQKKKYHHDIIGINSRLDTLQAAILNVKLKYLPGYSSKRREVAASYDTALKDIEQIEIPYRASYSDHVFHQYTLKVKERRNELKAYLERQGIPSMIYYPVPLHLQQAYHTSDYGTGSFPVTEMLSDVVLSLPIHTELEQVEIDYIVDHVRSFFK